MSIIPTHTPSPMLPEKFGRYEVQAEIGDGAMGRVYRAFDPLAHRVVAIKTLKSELLTRETAEEYLRRFRREAQAAGSLSHPHIVTIFDVGESFFVMELLEGRTLQEILRERGKIELAEALRIIGPVADALDFAHGKGIIHRDIKPGNIMVLPDGRPQIMDFGVAHLESTVMTAAGQFLGSPSYMAPEQIMNAEASPQTDLFSLAVLTYEIITGTKPFQGESITSVMYRVLNEVPPPPRKYNLELPPRYDEVFARALAKDPGSRFPSAAAFAAALELKEFDVALSRATATAPSVEDARTGIAAVAALETHDLKEGPTPTGSPVHPGLLPTEPMPVTPRRPVKPRALPALVGLLVVLAAGGIVVGRWPSSSSSTGPVPDAVVSGLRIETRPPGASVWLDGKEVGRAPLALPQVAPGTHTVRVAREGFASAELSLEVVAGASLAPLRFSLQPVTATLQLRSEPASAAVQVDGQPAGNAPIEGLSLALGVHEIRVENKGFRPWSRKIEARAGETVQLEARLQPGESRTREPTPPPLREGDLVELTPEVTPPKQISGASATYPREAAKGKLQGAVTLGMIVTETGEPTEVHVIESAGEILDQAVLEAVKKWRFEPARKQGIKVRVHWQVRQRFQRIP